MSNPKTPPTKRKSQETRPVTPLKLQYEDEFKHHPKHPPGQPSSSTSENPKDFFVFMALDILEEQQQSSHFHIWGVTSTGSSVLLRVHDFNPYFYISAPHHQSTPPSQDETSKWNDANQLELLKETLNNSLPSDGKIKSIEAVHRKPIVYYRPEQPNGAIYLKIVLAAGGNARKSGNSIQKLISSGRLASHGYIWRDHTIYEHEVSLLQRFLVDVPVSGGAWLLLPKRKISNIRETDAGGAAIGVDTPIKKHSHQVLKNPINIHLPHEYDKNDNNDKNNMSMDDDANIGYIDVSNRMDKISTCDIEIIAPWQAITCLSPDATQLADPSWTPVQKDLQIQPHRYDTAAVHEAMASAKRGDIAPLRRLILDVCIAPLDGTERTPVPQKGDPIVAISCAFFSRACSHATTTTATDDAHQKSGSGGDDVTMAMKHSERTRENVVVDVVVDDDITIDNEAIMAVSPLTDMSGIPPKVSPHTHQFWAGEEVPCAVSFILSRQWHAAYNSNDAAEYFDRYSNGRIIMCSTEEQLLLSWMEYMNGFDPDVLALYQVKDTLDVIHQRCIALGLKHTSVSTGNSKNNKRQKNENAVAGMYLSRYRSSPGQTISPIQIKKVTMYSAAWVRSQSRMSTTSNQETFKAENTDGRLVIDVLRHVLTNCNLSSFTLVDCAQNILGQTLEILSSSTLAQLSGITHTAGKNMEDACTVKKSNALRLARYSMKRVSIVHSLLDRLAVIPETIEMARATGLTIGQTAYNAQMIRTWSLLLRTAQRSGYIIPSRPETSPVVEHTFILHPVENGTTGLHREPVAILDFASLYPSIYQAYNLCYSTLLHPDDVSLLKNDHFITTPTGAAFVKPEICQGILPTILAALISARTSTKDQLKTVTRHAERAVLDSRQKALKITANALYGFTGAQSSPLQCGPMADSCLAYGAAACRRAKELLESKAAEGRFGVDGKDASVIYGHTDSLFVSLPRCTNDIAKALHTAQHAASIISAEFPHPIKLRFEKVCAPFLLLHVNRYAGRAFESTDDIASMIDNNTQGGELIVKGLKSMWRQAAPIIRTTLHGSLVRILMQNDIQGAVRFAEGEIKRLLSGNVSFYELTMTGGLWRLTGEQVESAASRSDAARDSLTTSPASDIEVRGPHAALAVRLAQRDPGKSFVLGERLQYVLTAGHTLQDEAAEVPLEAMLSGRRPALDIYWKNKLQKPLVEIFAACLSPAQLQSFVNGPHTLVKVDTSMTMPSPSSTISRTRRQGQSMHAVVARGRKGERGGGKGASSTHVDKIKTPTKKASQRSPAATSTSPPGSKQQVGIMSFYKATAKCLGCRRVLSGNYTDINAAPGLCESCSNEEGKRAAVYTNLIGEQSLQEARRCAAHTACRQCHSGLLHEDVVCENGECSVLYERYAADGVLSSLDASFARLDLF